MGFFWAVCEDSLFPVAFAVVLIVVDTFSGKAPFLLLAKSVKILSFSNS